MDSSIRGLLEKHTGDDLEDSKMDKKKGPPNDGEPLDEGGGTNAKKTQPTMPISVKPISGLSLVPRGVEGPSDSSGGKSPSFRR